jgi:hypothetical protein
MLGNAFSTLPELIFTWLLWLLLPNLTAFLIFDA